MFFSFVLMFCLLFCFYVFCSALVISVLMLCFCFDVLFLLLFYIYRPPCTPLSAAQKIVIKLNGIYYKEALPAQKLVLSKWEIYWVTFPKTFGWERLDFCVSYISLIAKIKNKMVDTKYFLGWMTVFWVSKKSVIFFSFIFLEGSCCTLFENLVFDLCLIGSPKCCYQR